MMAQFDAIRELSESRDSLVTVGKSGKRLALT
jgi:hypothetical protein